MRMHPIAGRLTALESFRGVATKTFYHSSILQSLQRVGTRQSDRPCTADKYCEDHTKHEQERTLADKFPGERMLFD